MAHGGRPPGSLLDYVLQQRIAAAQDASRVAPPQGPPAPPFLSPGPGPHGNTAPGLGPVHRLLQFGAEVGPTMVADFTPLGDISAGVQVAGDLVSGNVGFGTALAGISLLPLTPRIRASFPRTAVRVSDTPRWGRVATHSEHGILGAVRPAEELPERLYHVTAHADQVLESGALRATPEGGGLGGRSLPASISFTASREAAQNIERELLRVGGIARGEIKSFDDWIAKVAAADAQRMGLPPEALNRAVATARKSLKGGSPDDVFNAYTGYLQRRGEMAGTLFDAGSAERLLWEDPVFFHPGEGRSVADVYGDVNVDNVSVIEIDPRQIPEDVIVGAQPSLHADEWRIWTQEIPVERR